LKADINIASKGLWTENELSSVKNIKEELKE